MVSDRKLRLQLVIAIALACGFAVSGFRFYEYRADKIRQARRAEIATVGRLRASEIGRWRHEHLRDANVNATGIVQALLRESPDLSDPVGRDLLMTRLRSLKDAQGYATLLVARPDGSVLASVGPGTEHMDAAGARLVDQVARTRKAAFGEIFRCESCGNLHLDVAAPIPDASGQSVAVLIHRIDPLTSLFPLAQAWPVPSRSAETVLIRKEDEHVVFLNTLRHRDDPALNIRLPLTATETAAVLAVKGRTGTLEGLDYRGIPVLAEIVPIEQSDWLMVSKVDRDEILADILEESRWITVVVVLAILTVLAIGGFVARSRQARLQARLLSAEQEARRALEEAEARFRGFFEHAPIGKCLTLADGTIMTANQALGRMLGRAADDLRGGALEAFTHPDDVPKVREAIQRLQTGEKDVWTLELRYIARDGSTVHAHVTTSLLRDASGRPLHFLTHVEDVSRARLTEEALRDEERKFQALWRSMAAASCIDEIVYEDGKAVDYRMTEINPAFERIVGVARDQVVGRLASEIYRTTDVPFLDLYAKVAQTGEATSFEAYFPPIGKHLHVTASCPRPGWFSTVFTDVSDRKRMEDALRESEAKYRVLLEASPDPIFSLAPGGRYLYVNQAFADGVQRPVDWIIGRTIRDVFPPDEAERRMAPLDEAFRTGLAKMIEVRVPRSDGDRHFVTTLTPVERDDGTVASVICSSKDITARKRGEQAQARSIRRAQGLLDLLQQQDATEDELISFAVQKLVDITESRFVFIGRVDPAEQSMLTHFWSEQAARDCRIDSRSEQFEIASAGLWAEPIRRRSAIIENDCAKAATPGKGLPEGHVPVVRFLGVPTVRAGRVSLVAGMANKAEPYDEADLHEAQIFLEGLHEVLERRRAEALLQASTDRLHLAVKAADVGIWDRDVQTNEVHYSPEWKGQLGYAEDELADNQATWEEHLHPEDRNRVLARLDAFLADPALPYECEFRMRHKDGTYRWILARADLRHDAEGRPHRMLGTHVDVTLIKQAAEDIERQQQNLRAIMDSAPVPLLVFDEDARVVMANDAAARAFGCEDDDARIRRCGEYVGCAYRDDASTGCGSGPRCATCELNRAIRDVVRGGQGIRDREMAFDVTRESGIETFWYVGSVEPVTLDGRRRAILTLGDVSARKRMENALRASESRMRALYEESPLGYQSLDADGRLLDVNPRWMELFGCERDEVLGRWFGDFLAPADVADFRERFSRFLGTGQMHGVEYRVQKKDGSLAYVSIDGRVGRRPDGSFHRTHCVIRDITVEKRIELERLRFEATARHHQKLESIGTLAAGVAHEINNPLNVILNYGQLLVDNPGVPERTADFAGNIVKESERVATIVRNLLRFSRQDRESHSPARIADIVDRTLSLTGSLLQRDNIAIERDLPDGLPEIACRSQQIQQVVVNLVTNARDALNLRFPKTSPDKVIRFSARVVDKDGKPWVRLTVADRGPGIPPELAAKVFDPFFTTKARDQGTGLGLSISYGIVTEHGGEIWFEDEPGGGARFHVDLPANDADRPAAG